LEGLAPYLLDLAKASKPLNCSALFGNANPVEIEVGFGKGLFLLQASQSSPEVNFLGIEILRKYQLFTATRLAKRGLANVRLVQADARLFFHDFLASESMRAIHIYFPDPWWKRRHHKRRVFTSEFVAECRRILQPGGRLLMATDVADYFQLVTELMRAHPDLRPVPVAETADYRTNFERKFRQEGRSVYQGIWERLSGIECLG
jgi:tRNA (guanine-N7-)-methyltransferase